MYSPIMFRVEFVTPSFFVADNHESFPTNFGPLVIRFRCGTLWSYVARQICVSDVEFKPLWQSYEILLTSYRTDASHNLGVERTEV